MSTPSQCITAFVEAINAADEQQAQLLSTESGWNTNGDGPQSMFRQATRKNLTLHPPTNDVTMQEDRAVACISMSKGERQLGSFHALMILDTGLWKIEFLTKNLGHAQGYLENKLPALLRLQMLPSSPESEAVVQQIWQSVVAKDTKKLKGWMTSTKAQDAIMRLSYLHTVGGQLNLQKSLELTSVGRAGVELVVTSSDGKESQEFCFNMWKEDWLDDWKILSMTSFLSLRSMLEEPDLSPPTDIDEQLRFEPY